MFRAFLIAGAFVDVLLALFLLLVFGWVMDSWHDPKGTWVGIVVTTKPGDSVKAGDTLLELHHRGGRNLEAALALCREAISIGDEQPAPRQKILGEVR